MSMGSQTIVQLTGIAVVAIYTAIVTSVLLKLVGVVTSGIRVTADQEQVGLDITDHDETGYNM